MYRETKRQKDFQEMKVLNNDFIILAELNDLIYTGESDKYIPSDDNIIDKIKEFSKYLEEQMLIKQQQVNQLYKQYKLIK